MLWVISRLLGRKAMSVAGRWEGVACGTLRVGPSRAPGQSLEVACGTQLDQNWEEVCQISEGKATVSGSWLGREAAASSAVGKRPGPPPARSKILERWDLCFSFFNISQVEVALL